MNTLHVPRDELTFVSSNSRKEKLELGRPRFIASRGIVTYRLDLTWLKWTWRSWSVLIWGFCIMLYFVNLNIAFLRISPRDKNCQWQTYYSRGSRVSYWSQSLKMNWKTLFCVDSRNAISCCTKWIWMSRLIEFCR